MTDRDKAIEATKYLNWHFTQDDGTADKDAVKAWGVLLREREPKNVLDVVDSIEGIEVGKCPRCDRTILNKQSDPTRFCKYCGQAVMWN